MLARRADAVCFGTLAQRHIVSRDAIERFVAATHETCLRVLDLSHGVAGPFAARHMHFIVAVGALLIMSSKPLNAQIQIQDQPVFTSWRVADGLSHGAIHALLQDRTGFLWLGTQDGLNRFDGVRFRAWRNRRDDPNSLSDDYISALAEAPGGKLWVGTGDG